MNTTGTALSAFKAYDIRGRVPGEVNLELARKLGLAFAAEFAPREVCIGRDARLSSRDLSLVLENGLLDGGADVTDIGLCGTEELYHAVFSQGFDGGIMVTASHNPKDWNGFKLVRGGARPLSGESGLFALRERILAGDLPLAARPGRRRKKDFRSAYVRHLMSLLGDAGSLAHLTIVADAGNGCAWLPLRELREYLPCVLVPLRREPDGNFPHGVPNPLLPENRQTTRAAVLEHGAGLGLAWDGDFDRCFFFDEEGNFVEGYYMVGLLAAALLARHPGETILHDPRLTWNTREIVEEAGGIALETRTGHAFFKDRMRTEGALYGGEMSAHHYFRDFACCDSGMLAWLLVYQLMSRTGKPLSQLVGERMRRYPASGERNCSLDDPAAALLLAREKYAPQALRISCVDGVSMEFADWRFNLRPSNTEPLVRLNVESRGDEPLMRRKTEEILALLAGGDSASR
ncbi:MAG: phosphomannomutase [Desulfovibrio sp.]|jgi:phosphomannomutase|nr:phosphomannomutase [Desulfovibrio sp.]